jgi:hypothetical protein
MIDLSLSVTVLEVQPLQPWQSVTWRWKASRLSGGKRVSLQGSEDSASQARQVAAKAIAFLVEHNAESAGEE